MKYFHNRKKYFSIHHYIVWLRKQPAHMQHIYAMVFAGSITAFIAAGILYFDYGFWHEKYNSNDVVEVKGPNDKQVTVESPGEMISGFFKEAEEKFKSIGSSSTELLGGKEKYDRGMEKQ